MWVGQLSDVLVLQQIMDPVLKENLVMPDYMNHKIQKYVSTFVYAAKALLVFCRKDFCKAKPKMKSVFKFSDVLFALKSDGCQ